jgi:SAM-dependent methyltransferase
MTKFLRGVTRAVIDTFDLPAPVVEIGSFQVQEQEDLIDLRGLFPNKDFVGVDMRPGPGVDIVADVEKLPFPTASVGTVIALNTFEHVRKFWLGFEEIHRVLRPDGALFVMMPFSWEIHNHPNDYWRFTPEALHVLLEEYPTRIVGSQGPVAEPLSVWALGLREQAAPFTADQFARLKNAIALHARQPLRWQRRLRYRVFDMIDRRKLCSRLLEQENWRQELIQNNKTIIAAA